MAKYKIDVSGMDKAAYGGLVTLAKARGFADIPDDMPANGIVEVAVTDAQQVTDAASLCSLCEMMGIPPATKAE